MKYVKVKEYYNITRAKVLSALSCCVVISICSTATFLVDSALDITDVQAQPLETTSESTLPDTTESSAEETAETTDSSETVESAAETTLSSETSETTDPSESTDTSETSETTASETTACTTAKATEATTAETTKGITEEELFLAVYAKTTINVRSGPGTDYDIVKTLYSGDQIDVIAVTSNGWYKTYNGNYVKKDLTTETKPTATPTPKPTPKPTSSTTEAKQTESPSGSGNRCKITFYGPQPNGDGTYSKSTASGATCTEGQTVAADWSIYPKNSWIYIENDPLGGDGYYKVEDRGGGVNGYHIDIYAEDGESGSHTTCYRTVYAQ